jgi:hypothetical protein
MTKEATRAIKDLKNARKAKEERASQRVSSLLPLRADFRRHVKTTDAFQEVQPNLLKVVKYPKEMPPRDQIHRLVELSRNRPSRRMLIWISRKLFVERSIRLD